MAKSIYNRLIYSIHDGALERYARQYIRGRLIDIGCGTKPYRTLISPFVTEHIGLDHAASPHDKSNVDLVGSAFDIPADDSSFDSALCSSVLEHLEEPEQAIRECYRVLRSGGIAIYSMPFIWHLHEEPRDFFRYSKYGLRYLFEKAGFEIIEIDPLTGFWVTFGQLLVYNIYRFNLGPLRWLRVIDAIGLAIQGCAFVLEKLDKSERWTCMYMVVARKP